MNCPTHRISRTASRSSVRIGKSILCGSIWLACLLAARAAEITVTSTADSGEGSLRAALAAAGAGDTIAFNLPANSKISLASALPVISNNLTIDGSGAAGLSIDGSGGSRIFYVNSGTVAINNLTLANGLAQGGAGGNGGAGGGGGAGAGGAIFVGSGAAVSVLNVSFSGNTAKGGTGGGAVGLNLGGGGGGGMGGNGGSAVNSIAGAGGGGIGTGATGGNAGGNGSPGSPGILVGAGPGGAAFGGGAGGVNAGGGGGAGSDGGAGGGGGANGGNGNNGEGAAGGVGGGGGGATVNSESNVGFQGGAGGLFGGGGGAAVGSNGVGEIGGAAGFGGGAGGGAGNMGNTLSGGFAGGSSSGLSGGGGAGLGGAVFVSQGGTFTVLDGGFAGSNATLGGAAGGLDAAAGSGAGGALFLMGSGVTFNISGTNNSLIAADIADGASAGFAGALTKTGTGTLTLSSVNSYGGGTNFNGGVIAVSSDANLGSAGGALTFNGGTLQTLAGFPSARPVIVNEGGGTFDSNGFNSTLSGVISGNGVLTKIGAGTLTLSGINTYSGGTNFNGGVIAVSSDANLGGASGGGNLPAIAKPAIAAPTDLGSLNFNGGTLQTLAGITSARAVNLNVLGGTFDSNGFDSTLSGVVAGNGALSKIGGGTLTLSGTNTYSGGTNFNGGVIAVSSDANLGGLSGALQPLVSGDFSHVHASLSGTAPAFVVEVGNTPTLGALNFNGGTLRMLAGIASTRAVNLNEGGGFIDGNGFNSTFSGVISGSGALNLTDGGTITLTGKNTYSGGTVIEASAVAIESDGNLGAGSGQITLRDGTLQTLAGINSVRDITLNGFGVIDTNGFNSTLRGVISGEGLLEKDSAGTLTLTNANTYSGGTFIDAGAIAVGNTNALGTGSVFVSGTAILEATGAPKVIHIGGSYFGGGEKGEIARNVINSNGGTLILRLGGANVGQYDMLQVDGSANLGGTLELLSYGGFSPKPGEHFTLITATEGVSGTFSKVEQPDFALKLDLQYLSNSVNGLTLGAPLLPGQPPGSVTVTIEQIPFVVFGKTPNQIAVAQDLDKVIFDHRETKLIEALDSIPVQGIPDALDRIAPADLTAIFQTAVSLAGVQAENIERRLEDLRAGSSGFNSTRFSMVNSESVTMGFGGHPDAIAAYDSKDGKNIAVMQPAPDNRWGVFISGQGEFTHVGNGDFNARGYDLDTGGFTLGVDYRVNANLVLGLSAGYAHTDADLTAGGRVNIDGAKFGGYGTFYSGGAHLDAAVNFGYNSYYTRRASLGGSASGDTNGDEINALFGAGYDWKHGNFTFGPLATFQYTDVRLGAFSETGSLAPLQYRNQSQDSLRTNAGVQASYLWKLGSGIVIKPEVKLTWQHEYGEASYALDSTLASGAGDFFTVHGPRIGRDSLVVSAGLSVQWNDRLTTYAYFDGEEFRENYDSQNVSAGVGVSF